MNEFMSIFFSAATGAFVAGLIVKVFIERSVNNIFDHKIADYKNHIFKNQIVFNERIEALKALNKIYYHTLPKRSFEDEEWERACTEIAFNSDSIEKKLEIFLTEFDHFISTGVSKKIKSANSVATDLRIELENQTLENNEYDRPNKIFDNIKEARNLLRNELETEAKINN